MNGYWVLGVGCLSFLLGGLVGYGAYKVFLAEMRGWKEVFGRELNEGENIMPSPLLALLSLLMIGGGVYLIRVGVGLVSA